MENNTTLLRRDLLIRLLKIFFAEQDFTAIDRIPVEMTPRNTESAIRCCIYRERAVTRSGIISILGFDNSFDDEVRQLSSYATESWQRPLVKYKQSNTSLLSVLQEGCSHCIRTNYIVTDACRNCVARPCQQNCPKEAISFRNNRAFIDPQKCINCGICQKRCPFQAITYIPVPCEDVCPVEAIGKDEQGKVEIDFEKCILCGKCMKACPFGAIFEKSQVISVVKAMQSGKPVAAILAPASAGQFPLAYGRLLGGLRSLGFALIAEAAYGADLTAAAEAEEWREMLASGKAMLTTSCCPSYLLAAQKHLPQMQKYISQTPSPMSFTAEKIKQLHPEMITVFIGPCLAKKAEAAADANTDLVISFEELGTMLAAKNIQLQSAPESQPDFSGSKDGSGFAASGGVINALSSALKSAELKPYRVDGINRKNLKLLKVFAAGKAPANFIEVMACEGGCIAGPNNLNSCDLAARFFRKYQESLE
ncbi:MAG: monomeric [FeFe] hydrogenase [Candidatus Cloacimonadales bacterium]